MKKKDCGIGRLKERVWSLGKGNWEQRKTEMKAERMTKIGAAKNKEGTRNCEKEIKWR